MIGGAYGIAVDGPDVPIEQLVHPVPSHWIPVPISFGPGPATPADEHLGERSGSLACAFGGAVVVERDPWSARFVGPRPPGPDELLHPGLAGIAVLAAGLLDRCTVHAATVVGADGAWMVLGPKGAGKSTMSAALARRGHPIVADDLAVIDGDRVLAGPRSIDLRPDAAATLGVQALTSDVRLGDRRRLTPDPVAPEVPLAGIVELVTADRVTTQAVGPADRLALLLQHVALPERGSATRLLELSGLRALRLHRPHRRSAIDATVDAIVGVIGPPPT